MKIAIRYGSHLPVLMKIVEMTDGPILELGIGLYSTPYLHYACLPHSRKLESFEADEGWMRSFRDCRNSYHEVNFVADWEKLSLAGKWDIAFIDHSPDNRRHIEAKRLSESVKYIILHDSDPENDNLYKFSEVYPLFKYRFDYTAVKPNTTVLSNFVDLADFKI